MKGLQFSNVASFSSKQSCQREVGSLFGFYDLSTFVGYLTPNPFLYKTSVLFQTIQSCISTQLNKNISISSYSV